MVKQQMVKQQMVKQQMVMESDQQESMCCNPRTSERPFQNVLQLATKENVREHRIFCEYKNSCLSTLFSESKAERHGQHLIHSMSLQHLRLQYTFYKKSPSCEFFWWKREKNSLLTVLTLKIYRIFCYLQKILKILQ